MENQRVQVEFVANYKEIDAALWRKCFPPPLEGHFWYHTLENSGLEKQFEFHYALIRSGDAPVGIIPCFTHNLPIALVAPKPVAVAINLLARIIPRISYQRTFFVGSPCSDEGTIGLLPGVELADVASVVIEAIQSEARKRKASMVVFKDFAPTALTALEGSGSKRGFFRVMSYPGTVVTLTPPDKTAYLAGLSQGQRHNLKKKLRRSQEILPLATSIAATPSDAELTEICNLFQQTYERGKTKFERLDRRFFENIRECPEAHFILQREKATGQLLTFMLVFHLGDRIINKFIGLDYRHAGKTYLYFRLFDAALDFAYASGAKELQSGQTGYRAKLDLGHRLVPLSNLVCHQNPLAHAIFRTIGRRVTWKTLDEDLAVYLRAHPDHSEKH